MPASDDYPLTPAEVAFLRTLAEAKVRFMLVGLASAVIQGAPLMTVDLDLWFEDIGDPGIAAAAKSAGGIFVGRSDPPMIAGKGLDRLDIVTHLHGLKDFSAEYRKATKIVIEDFTIKILPIERVLASTLAAGRPKDRAAIAALKAAIAVIPKGKRT